MPHYCTTAAIQILADNTTLNNRSVNFVQPKGKGITKPFVVDEMETIYSMNAG